MMNQNTWYISTKEAAEISGFPQRTIQEWAKKELPGFPVIRNGRNFRINRCAFQEWLKSQEGEAVNV